MYRMDQGAWFNLVALLIVNGFFAIAGMFLNFLVILSFCKSSRLAKKSCCFLILMLSCSDLVVVIALHPLLMLSSIAWFVEKNYQILYQVRKTYLRLACGFSLFTLLTMNIERYLAVVHPYFYQRSVTKQRLLIVLAIFWLFVVLTNFLFVGVRCRRGILDIAIIGIVFSLLVYITYGMFVVVRKIQRNDESMARGWNPSDQSSHQSKKRIAHDFKMVSTYTLVVGCFALCFFPVTVYNGFIGFKCFSNDDTLLNSFVHWAYTFATMNSTFNCVIFFWRNKTLRHEGKKLLWCCRGCSKDYLNN